MDGSWKAGRLQGRRTVNQVYNPLTCPSMAADNSPPGTSAVSEAAPQRERAVGLGPAVRRAWIGYQRRLDMAMADAGFDERRVPDGRVLRLCSDPAGSTISNIGRELELPAKAPARSWVIWKIGAMCLSPIHRGVEERRRSPSRSSGRSISPLNAERFEPSSFICVRN
jgi:hypothetical protein